MAKPHDHITDEHARFIAAQQMFFVATAPLSAAGHVNLSPKGLDTFRVISERCVAYLDLTGSGNETSAHLYENGRITFMFCALQGNPMILRLYGRGKTILPDAADWANWLRHFPTPPQGVRQIIVADIDRVQTSCGFAVPRYEFVASRNDLLDWAARKGIQGLSGYRDKNNRVSIDGLPTPLAESHGQ